MKAFFVYMMTNRSRVVLYTGVTNDLERRVWEPKNGTAKGFTKQYKLDRLVYSENYGDVRDAITREKEIKGWRREKKNALVRTLNPLWNDLGPELFNEVGEVPHRLRGSG
jgi:putative endonuclease